MFQRAAGFVFVCLLASAGVAFGHDIPNDVTVQMFVRPEGHTLRVLVRVPLIAMRDMDYPRRGARNSELLDLSRADSTLRDAATLWVGDFIDLYEGDTQLPKAHVTAVRASLPSDRSFTSYEEALAHITGPPLPGDMEYTWSQGILDIAFEYPIESEQSRFSIRPRLARLGLRTLVVLRFLPPGGAVRAFEFEGEPGLVFLDPSWRQAALQFVRLGFDHILDGIDHLLFLFCLVIPFRRMRSLIAVITSFTVAHSITLLASAYNLAPDALWFPPLIETLIAASIVYMALENIVVAAGQKPQSTQNAQSPEFSAVSADSAVMSSALHRRWLITFGFGLVHGFGFSFALRQTLQFAGTHMLSSLLAFNVGVELGQLLVLAALVPALALLFRFVVEPRVGMIILSALVGHTAWHWMAERYGVLRQYRIEWPAIDAAFWVMAMRAAMVVVAVAALYWLFGVLRAARGSAASEEGLTTTND